MKNKSTVAKILIFSLLINVISPIFAEDTTPLPYDENAMPQTLKDLRRFEIITLGSLPFVTLDAGIVYSGIRWANNGFDANYSPNPFGISNYSTEEQMGILLTSVGISVGIALTDYIINLIKRSKKKKQEQFANSNIFITPLSKDKDAVPITTEDDFYEKKESYENSISTDNNEDKNIEEFEQDEVQLILENQETINNLQEITEAEE